MSIIILQANFDATSSMTVCKIIREPHSVHWKYINLTLISMPSLMLPLLGKSKTCCVCYQSQTFPTTMTYLMRAYSVSSYGLLKFVPFQEAESSLAELKDQVCDLFVCLLICLNVNTSTIDELGEGA